MPALSLDLLNSTTGSFITELVGVVAI